MAAAWVALPSIVLFSGTPWQRIAFHGYGWKEAAFKKGLTACPPPAGTNGPSPPRSPCCHSSLTGAAAGHLAPPLPPLGHGERGPSRPLFRPQRELALQIPCKRLRD